MYRFLTPVFSHTHLLKQYTSHLIQRRYRGSIFGLAWSFITPLLLLTIYSFVFTVVFKARWGGITDGYASFALFLFSGIMLHGFLMDGLTQATTIISDNPNFVKKVVFPLETLVCSIILGAAFQWFLSVIVLFVAMLILGYDFSPVMLFYPILLFPLFIAALGGALLISALSVYIRDFVQMVPVLSTVLMFTSTIFFPVDILPNLMQRFIYLNPLTYPVEISRDLLFHHHLPNLWSYSLFTVVAIGVYLTGVVVFSKLRRGFADVL